MATSTTISEEYAAALRKVNAEFACLPRSVQGSIEIVYDDLDREVDAALVFDDRSRAIAAVEAFKRHWLRVFEEAAQR